MQKNFFNTFPALEEPVTSIVLQGVLTATYKLSSINVDLLTLTPLFLVLANCPWRRSGLQVPNSYKELKQPKVNSSGSIRIIFYLVTLRQHVSILKTSQSEEHSIARAQDEGRGPQSNHDRRGGGTGKQPQQKKNNTKRQKHKWQGKTDDSHNWHREVMSWNGLKR